MKCRAVGSGRFIVEVNIAVNSYSKERKTAQEKYAKVAEKDRNNEGFYPFWLTCKVFCSETQLVKYRDWELGDIICMHGSLQEEIWEARDGTLGTKLLLHSAHCKRVKANKTGKVALPVPEGVQNRGARKEALQGERDWGSDGFPDGFS